MCCLSGYRLGSMGCLRRLGLFLRFLGRFRLFLFLRLHRLWLLFLSCILRLGLCWWRVGLEPRLQFLLSSSAISLSPFSPLCMRRGHAVSMCGYAQHLIFSQGFYVVCFVWLWRLSASLSRRLRVGLCFCVGLLFEPVLVVKLR